MIEHSTLIEWCYKSHVRPKVFARGGLNAERGHEWGMQQLRLIQQSWLKRWLAEVLCGYSHKMLETTVFGITFPNPLGLAAGFDKHCEVFHTAVPAFGWGSCDIGGICRDEQVGTDYSDTQPRLMRSLEYQALWNQMGFNNPGKEKARKILASSPKSLIPIGLNIGKSMRTEPEDAPRECAEILVALWDCVDYFVINVSSPNTKGLRKLQGGSLLAGMISAAHEANLEVAYRRHDTGSACKPIGVKFAPDLTADERREVAATVLAFHRAGQISFIELVNTTVSRTTVPDWDVPVDRGGVSGHPLTSMAEVSLLDFRRLTEGAIPLVGTGGIYDGRTLFRRVLLGASVCRAYTAWVFEGPDFVKRTLIELVGHLDRCGFRNVAEAVGKAKTIEALAQFGV